MRGSDERMGELFSYVDLEKRVPAKHPLRLVRGVVNEVLAALDSEPSRRRPIMYFETVDSATSNPSFTSAVVKML